MIEETGFVPQPLEEEEFFQSLRRGPPPQPQPPMFASFKEVTPTFQGFMFSSGSTETKKPTTYEIYQQIKRQEAERKREKDRRGKAPKEEESENPSPKISRALMVKNISQQNPLTSFLQEYKELTTPKIAAISHDPEETEHSSDYESSGSSDES
ncbi:hypothetical protein V6N12_063143 [Hibiscus sabdariffa]|uniref:Uncharacterized protein n=1 Tax=Hibiscus sabdariffa TaxID=183260 RepID=A0ABR2FAX3_9ROSI